MTAEHAETAEVLLTCGMLERGMGQVVLVGRDWKARALLRAQLIEEGVEVEAYETVGDSLRAVKGRFQQPALLVADVSTSGDAKQEISQLAMWSVPVWVIASRTSNPEKELEGQGFEAVLWRPVGVGELVEQIKRRLSRKGTEENRE